MAPEKDSWEMGARWCMGPRAGSRADGTCGWGLGLGAAAETQDKSMMSMWDVDETWNVGKTCVAWTDSAAWKVQPGQTARTWYGGMGGLWGQSKYASPWPATKGLWADGKAQLARDRQGVS